MNRTSSPRNREKRDSREWELFCLVLHGDFAPELHYSGVRKSVCFRETMCYSSACSDPSIGRLFASRQTTRRSVPAILHLTRFLPFSCSAINPRSLSRFQSVFFVIGSTSPCWLAIRCASAKEASGSSSRYCPSCQPIQRPRDCPMEPPVRAFLIWHSPGFACHARLGEPVPYPTTRALCFPVGTLWGCWRCI
jgi:hypothetical protein